MGCTRLGGVMVCVDWRTDAIIYGGMTHKWPAHVNGVQESGRTSHIYLGIITFFTMGGLLRTGR